MTWTSNHLALFLGLALLASCDIVDDPIPPTNSGNGSGDSTVTRKVLLEEFTGHRCNNCPAAHAIAAQLQALYPEDLITVGIHATSFFAAPINPPNADGSYATDFRTTAGEAYVQAFGVSFLPIGMVNRMESNGSIPISPSAWGSVAADIIGQPADLDIWFSQLVHDAANNTVSAEVKVAVLNTVDGDHNLIVHLTEDHVIDWQLDAQSNPPNIENYDHRHVLRATISGTWGAPLISGSAAAGDTLTLSYTNYNMDPAWDAANCALVAFVYNSATNEVMQAEERKFEP